MQMITRAALLTIRNHKVYLVAALMAYSLARPALMLGDDAHPLNSLSASEYRAVTRILQRADYVDDASRYVWITLHEPDKRKVLGWKPGESLSRQAFVVVRKGPRTFEAVVDISTRKVTTWKPMDGVQSSLLAEEWTDAQTIVKQNAKWRAAVGRRGISDFEKVVCIPLTVGYFGGEREREIRLVKVVAIRFPSNRALLGPAHRRPDRRCGFERAEGCPGP